MAIQPGVWGIDLGQCALKAVRLQDVEGTLTATAFDYVEHPKILSQPDADPDQLTREALEKFLSRNVLRGDIVAISVPGQSGLARFVKLPPVEEKKISDIVRFEAKQQIPFNLEEVVWDYQKIGSGVVTDGFAMETEIGLFAMKRDMVFRYLQHFKDVNVEVHVVQMAPLALCNFVAFDLLAKGAGEPDGESAGKRQCVVALDIGADSSNLVITDGERVIWQRPIPLGGNHFTRALTKDLKLTFAKAEHLKRNATKSPDLKKILAALKPVLNDFVGEVQRSLGYFTNTHRDAHIQYMVGLGNAFRLPGLQRFLGEKLQLDVRKLGKLERLTGDPVVSAPIFQENILSFGVAYGLALQGMKRARLITNLLPQEIRTERLVRAKKPWAVAAAAALLLGSGAMAFSYFLEDRTYGSDSVAGPNGAIKKAKSAVDAVNDAEKKFKDAQDEANKEENAVKSIVAGSQERLNWLELTKFINDVVPRPDGINLPKTARAQVFWSDPKQQKKMTGKAAWDLYQTQKRGAKSDWGVHTPGLASDELPSMIDDLIQFNIEGVSVRYCDDLAAYWKGVQEVIKDADYVRPPELYRKAPEDKAGWIVELRGYTFHHKKATFVLDALLDNIRLRGDVKTPPAGDQPAGAQPAQTAADQPSGTPAAPPKHVVVGQITHPVLYLNVSKPTSEVGQFEYISQSHLADVIRGPAAAGPGGPGMMPGAPAGGAPMMQGPGGPGGAGMAGSAAGDGAGAPTAPTRDGWAALGSDHAGGGGAGAGRGMPGMPGGPGGKGAGGRLTVPTMPGGPGGPVMPGAPGGAGAAPQAGASNAAHWRTEFVIFFVWKEWTPSDELRGQGAAATENKAP